MKHKALKNKDEAKLIMFGRTEDNSREMPIQVIDKSNILVYDFDGCSNNRLQEVKDALQGTQYILHTTHSHDPQANNSSFRVLRHTTEDLSGEDYTNAYWNSILSNPKLKRLHDEGCFDHKAEEAARGWCIPSAPPEKIHLAESHIGTGIPFSPNTQNCVKPNNVSSIKAYKTEGMIGAGERNDTLTSIAGKLIKDIKVKEIVREKLHGINQLRCDPPLANHDVDTILNSIWKSHQIKHPEDKLQELVKVEVDEFDDIEIYQPSVDVLEVEPPPRKFVFDGFVPEGIVGAIAAQGGVGKSFTCLAMCSSVASGIMLYNKWTVGHQGVAVYISGEETRDEIERRLFYINRTLPYDYKKKISENIRIISFADKYFPFIKKDKDGNIIITDTVEKLTEKLLKDIKEPISMIIVDPISRFRDGDENDNTAGTRFVQALQKIRADLNDRCTLLGAAHVNKSSEFNGHSQNNVRGASAFVDGCRFVIEMGHLSTDKQKKLFDSERTADERYIYLDVTKTNYTPMLDPIYLRIHEEGVLKPADNVGEHTTLAIIKELEHGSYTKSAFKEEHSGAKGKYGLAEKEMVKKINEMKKQGLIEETPYQPLQVTEKGREYIASVGDE
jgi:RecA-family ATPase